MLGTVNLTSNQPLHLTHIPIKYLHLHNISFLRYKILPISMASSMKQLIRLRVGS
jgi:hypothetical protein